MAEEYGGEDSIVKFLTIKVMNKNPRNKYCPAFLFGGRQERKTYPDSFRTIKVNLISDRVFVNFMLVKSVCSVLVREYVQFRILVFLIECYMIILISLHVTLKHCNFNNITVSITHKQDDHERSEEELTTVGHYSLILF